MGQGVNTPVEPEIWLAIPAFPDYEVSSWARVKSRPRPGARGGGILRGYLNSGGYMTVTLRRDGQQFTRRVHQLVAEAFLGPRPPGQEVRHGPAGKLNNRPENLSYGTKDDNNGPDKRRDGTQPFGEAVWNAKLTMAIVSECRKRCAMGEHIDMLAREFRVTFPAMGNAIRGATWRDCPVPPFAGGNRGERNPEAKLTEAVVLECRARKVMGETVAALAREFGVSRPTMDAAITGKTWKYL